MRAGPGAEMRTRISKYLLEDSADHRFPFFPGRNRVRYCGFPYFEKLGISKGISFRYRNNATQKSNATATATPGSNHKYCRGSAEFEIRFPLPSPKRAIENLTAGFAMNYSLGDLLLHNIRPREKTS
ncbi:hypothetical protein CEXT_182551 [Caerostris extrusa]|uniref:Uncharacterized protein n=1 Tax=Caerostris extrusa TaxID=172846 RepID=A0AAV4MVJ5_CAEEX|nr:hypothetical protein CEXT_182551 [Caerostris extrusa]